jgi:hypothetical protein
MGASSCGTATRLCCTRIRPSQREGNPRRLTGNGLKPWRKDMKYTPHIDGAHPASMEDVLDLYALEFSI